MLRFTITILIVEGLIIDGFDFEEIDRYQLTIIRGEKKLINTSNNLEQLKRVFDDVVSSNILTDERIEMFIYDYDKDANVEYYDTDNERC